MCVIAVAEETRPTEKMVEKMFNANKNGAGIAWREGDMVKWKKGLKLEEVQKLCAEVPLPFVVHFRIPSCGGDYDFLCHPFPIEKGVSLALKGSTKGFVLFHNGHWGPWKNNVMETVIKRGGTIPNGKWSDTRAMAFMAANYGLGILEMIDEKAVAFGPNVVESFGTGWGKVNDVWVSNKGWESGFYQTDAYDNMYGGGGSVCMWSTCKNRRMHNSRYCFDHCTDDKRSTSALKKSDKIDDKVETKTEKKGGGTSEETPFREDRAPLQLGPAQQEAAQEGSKEVAKTAEAEEEARQDEQDFSLMAGHEWGVPDIFRWARSINKKVIRSSGATGDETVHLNERWEAAKKGIQIVGKL